MIVNLESKYNIESKYNNIHQPSIGKKSIHANYSALPEKTQSSFKTPKFKVDNRLRITKNIFSKGYTGNWSKEVFVIDSVLKTNPWTHEIKDLNRQKVIGSFHEKELFLSKL